MADLQKVFADSFSAKQKAAVIASMVIISRTSTGISPEESSYIEQIAELLRINYDDPELEVIPQKGRAYLATLLNTLTESNKEWLAYTVYVFLGQKGRPDERRLLIALNILEDIGISEDDLIKIVDKSEAIYQRFKKR